MGISWGKNYTEEDYINKKMSGYYKEYDQSTRKIKKEGRF